MRNAALFVLGASVACSAGPDTNAETNADYGVGRTTEALAPAWTGTWSVSPQGTSGSFDQQTLRQIVHTSIAGSAARVQISNLYGSQPLHISNVHIALRSSGSSINASTDRTVAFAGSGSLTVAAGALAVSDSVAFSVPALSDVAVSFYVPQASGPATFHSVGKQTNYVASGNVAASANLSSPTTTSSYYFLTNLDVQNTSSLGAVVTLGASLTDGVGSTQNSNRRWPNDLAVRLVSSGRVVGVLNQGISGNRLLVNGSGASALNRFDRDVLGQAGIRWVIFSDDPINDLGSTNPPPSGAQLISGLTQLIHRAHQAGVRFLCSTLTPYQGAGYWTSQGETGREQVNSFIRSAASGCDGVVDQDVATHDPSAPTKFLPAYDSGDHLHPNEAGLQAIANAVDLNTFSVPSGPDEAWMYPDCYYKVSSIGLQRGCYSLSELQMRGLNNDTLSSLWTATGYQTVLYNDDWASGYSAAFDSSTAGQATSSCLLNSTAGRADGTSWNDHASSLCINRSQGTIKQLSSGKCVHPDGGSPTPSAGTHLVMWNDCDSSETRLDYLLRTDGSVQQQSSGKCLQPEGGSTMPANGTQLVFWDSCGANQSHFQITAGGALQHVTSGRCIHPLGDSTNPANGTRLVLADGCYQNAVKFQFTP